MTDITDTATATALGGRFTFPGTDISVNRMGYGAMQLAGPHVFGPPKDPEAAVAVLQEAMALGIDHIDTSDFYGPHHTNHVIRQALHPYPAGLTLVTKIGAYRDDEGGWLPDLSDAGLERSIDDNLRNLGIDQVPVVNLRVMTPDDDVTGPLNLLRKLQDDGRVAHVGLSTVTPEQLARGRDLAPIVCVQNHYNLAHREDDAMIDALAADGIAYVPYFPLGGFSPLQSDTLSEVAQGLDATPMQVALAWLLRRSPNILLIPGTSSVAHLRENVAAATLDLPAEAMTRLDGIAG